MQQSWPLLIQAASLLAQVHGSGAGTGLGVMSWAEALEKVRAGLGREELEGVAPMPCWVRDSGARGQILFGTATSVHPGSGVQGKPGDTQQSLSHCPTPTHPYPGSF